jgi:alpha/beta hydrolase fold
MTAKSEATHPDARGVAAPIGIGTSSLSRLQNLTAALPAAINCGLFAGLLFTAEPAAGATNAEPAYGPELQGFDYPFPVKDFAFTSQGESLRMAYMDVAPAAPNGRTIVLLHGKNFCAATWEETIKVLSHAGYRVIAPDQIGFCKSSKPECYQFSFQQLARNMRALLDSLGVKNIVVMGHSTGGMLAVRYALMYPQDVDQLVLVNPIGLEDWKAKGVPSLSVDEWYARELKTTAERIRDYERTTYYVDQWKDSYEPWVQMLAGMYRGEGSRRSLGIRRFSTT